MTAKPASTRKSVTLTSEDLNDLQLLKAGDSNMTTAFKELTGVMIGARTSEAEVLHALLALGRNLVREREQAIAYQRAAEVDALDPERQRWRDGMRRRRTRHERTIHP